MQTASLRLSRSRTYISFTVLAEFDLFEKKIVVVRERGSGVLFHISLRNEQERNGVYAWIVLLAAGKPLNEYERCWLCIFQESLYLACHVSDAKQQVSNP